MNKYKSPNANARPLTDEQILAYAPSVFATEAHGSRGDRYRFISSSDLVLALRGQGFQPIRVQQSRAKDADKREHTKHMVVFRHSTDIARLGVATSSIMDRYSHQRVNETVNEIVLYNSHDGSSSYQLHAGKFRLVCSNGLIVADTQLASVRVPHFGQSVTDRVIEGAFHVLEQLPQVDQVIGAWRGLPMPRTEALALADAAMDLRWSDGERPGTLEPAELLRIRRSSDQGDDLWTVFNRIQEALLQGGARYRTAKGERGSTRAVGSVQESLRLNKALWKLTAHMAHLRGVGDAVEGDIIEGEVVG